MLKIKIFINDIIPSNCFLIYDELSSKCVVVDPSTEKSEQQIGFINNHNLSLDYIILTHEHGDHVWGVNALKDRFPNSKIVCTGACNRLVKKLCKIYFLLYHEDPRYRFEMYPADVVIDTDGYEIKWGEYMLKFKLTPGHSYGSMCIDIDDKLFTGDTILPFEPYLTGRDGNKNEWKMSIDKMLSTYVDSTIVYPGHGNPLTLGNWKLNFLNLVK